MDKLSKAEMVQKAEEGMRMLQLLAAGLDGDDDDQQETASTATSSTSQHTRRDGRTSSTTKNGRPSRLRSDNIRSPKTKKRATSPIMLSSPSKLAPIFRKLPAKSLSKGTGSKKSPLELSKPQPRTFKAVGSKANPAYLGDDDDADTVMDQLPSPEAAAISRSRAIRNANLRNGKPTKREKKRRCGTVVAQDRVDLFRRGHEIRVHGHVGRLRRLHGMQLQLHVQLHVHVAAYQYYIRYMLLQL